MSNENETKKENDDALEVKKYKDEKIEKRVKLPWMKIAVITGFT